MSKIIEYRPTPKFNLRYILTQSSVTILTLIFIYFFYTQNLIFLGALLVLSIFTLLAKKQFLNGKSSDYIAIDTEENFMQIDDKKIPLRKIKSFEKVIGGYVQILDYDYNVFNIITPDSGKLIRDLKRFKSLG